MSEATRQLFHHEFLDPKGATYQGRKEDGRKETSSSPAPIIGSVPFTAASDRMEPFISWTSTTRLAVHNDTRGPAHGARNAATRPDRDTISPASIGFSTRRRSRFQPFKLDSRDPVGLVKMLDHPNGWTRSTANRLLNETQPVAAVKPAHCSAQEPILQVLPHSCALQPEQPG